MELSGPRVLFRSMINLSVSTVTVVPSRQKFLINSVTSNNSFKMNFWQPLLFLSFYFERYIY